MIKTEVGQFTSSQTAPEQRGNDRSVSLALERLRVKGLPLEGSRYRRNAEDTHKSPYLSNE